MTDVAFATPVVHNQFPAKVTHPDGTVTDKARAVLTPELLVVYVEKVVDGGRKRATTAHSIPITSMHADPAVFNGWVAVDEDGGHWHIAKGKGCGCHSPLKLMPNPPPVDL